MTGLILAAGRGSRMGDSTQMKPKCLVELAGRTLFEWQTLALVEGGVEEVCVVCGYRAEMIPDIGRKFFNDEWEKTNMVCSLLSADVSGLDVIVSYSDIAYHPSHVSKLYATPGDIVVCYDKSWLNLWSRRFDDVTSDAESFFADGDLLLEIGKPVMDLEEIRGQFMGLVKLSAHGFECIRGFCHSIPPEQLMRLDFTELLGRLIDAGHIVNVCEVDGMWCEADSESDLALYNRLLKEGGWQHDWRWDV